MSPQQEPLPSVLELGRSLSAIEAEYLAIEDVDRENTPAETARMDALSQQENALRSLISTLPACTLADAAVQLAVAVIFAFRLETTDWQDRREHQRLDSLHEAVSRITLSVMPLVAKAAGLDMAAMGWSHLQFQRSNSFGLPRPDLPGGR